VFANPISLATSEIFKKLTANYIQLSFGEVLQIYNLKKGIINLKLFWLFYCKTAKFYNYLKKLFCLRCRKTILRFADGTRTELCWPGKTSLKVRILKLVLNYLDTKKTNVFSLRKVFGSNSTSLKLFIKSIRITLLKLRKFLKSFLKCGFSSWKPFST
jgi:hypothetical protein